MLRDETETRRLTQPTLLFGGQMLPLIEQKAFAMTMREAVGGLSSAEVSVVDWTSDGNGGAGYAAREGEDAVLLGAPIEIYAGDEEVQQRIFAGRISAIETERRRVGAPLFTMLAEDPLYAARLHRRSRTFEDSSPADIVRAIASDHGLQADIEGLDQPMGDWTQLDETDLAFLRRSLSRVDADMQVVDGVLQAGPRAARQRTELVLVYPHDLLSVRVTADLAGQRTSTRLRDWDGLAGRAVEEEAEDGEFGPGRGTDGPTAFERAFGRYPARLGGEGPLNQTEASALARAAHGARARRFVTADGTAKGDPSLRVGSWITLLGVNPMFENDYVVVSGTHRYDMEEGYVTDFIAESAYLNVSQA